MNRDVFSSFFRRQFLQSSLWRARQNLVYYRYEKSRSDNRKRVVTIASAALALVSCDSSETLRYRLSLEVETPEGLRSGSSVIEVEVRERSDKVVIGNAVRLRARGEAVAVELPGGKFLFALLTDESSSNAASLHPWRAFNPGRGDGHEWGVGPARELKFKQKARSLPLEYYPTLVTFADIDDPTTLEIVDPKNLPVTFGEGFAMRQITVQMTSDVVQNTISQKLKWLDKSRSGMLNGDRYQDFSKSTDAARVGHGAFSTETSD